MSLSTNPYDSPSATSLTRHRFAITKRTLRFCAVGLIAVVVYVLSYAPVYWIVDALGIDSDGVWLALGLFYMPIWLVAQLSPLDAIVMWYWELFLPPIG